MLDRSINSFYAIQFLEKFQLSVCKSNVLFRISIYSKKETCVKFY